MLVLSKKQLGYALEDVAQIMGQTYDLGMLTGKSNEAIGADALAKVMLYIEKSKVLKKHRIMCKENAKDDVAYAMLLMEIISTCSTSRNN